MDVTAIVLAGGRGSRMNHEDKAWLNFQDKPLIKHVIDRIAPQVKNIVISRNRSHHGYQDLPYINIVDEACSDDTTDFLGPLAGVSACICEVKTELVLVVPCDTPMLPVNLVEVLRAGLQQQQLMIANDGKRDQPLVMLGFTDQVATVTSYLANGGRSVMGWLEDRDYGVAKFEDSNAFVNINEPEQLE